MVWETGSLVARRMAQPMRRWRQHLGQFAVRVMIAALAALVLYAPAYAQETIHVIERGDNLTRVAKQYNVDPAYLAAYNNISDPNHIELGRSLKIPAAANTAEQATDAAVPVMAQELLPGMGGYHTVNAGESLTAIARRYDLTTSDLMRLNGLTDADHILIGQPLRLTAKVGRMPSPTSAQPALAGTIYVVQEGDTLSEIARDHHITLEQLLQDNGLPHAEFVYVGQRLRIGEPTYVAKGLDASQAPASGARKIVIDLSDQTLMAYQGGTVVMQTSVSTGKASTPTVIGEFSIYVKYDSQRMTGDDYDLEGVPWVMYYDGDFGIHGAYWHNAFGVPTSHGCVNMRPDEAKALYEWADVGTPVVVQW